jgi:proteasome regulatory subunit
VKILQIHTREMNVASDVDFEAVAADLDDYSGADLNALTTEAGMFAIRDGRSEVRREDFENAREKVEDDEEGPLADQLRPYQY